MTKNIHREDGGLLGTFISSVTKYFCDQNWILPLTQETQAKRPRHHSVTQRLIKVTLDGLRLRKGRYLLQSFLRHTSTMQYSPTTHSFPSYKEINVKKKKRKKQQQQQQKHLTLCPKESITFGVGYSRNVLFGLT